MTTSVKEEQFKIFDNVAKAYVDKVFNSLGEAEAHKEQLLDNGEYPDRPHTVFEIHPVASVKEEVKQELLREERTLYVLHDVRTKGGNIVKVNKFWMGVYFDHANGVTENQGNEYAKHVQNAVNSHYELLEALKEVLKTSDMVPSVREKVQNLISKIKQ